jgi:hypothetical protein
MKWLYLFAAAALLCLAGCDAGAFAGLLQPTPSPTPSSPASQIILTPDTTTAQVGEVITVHMRVINLGIPQYTITLTPGASLRVLYTGNSSEVLATADAPVFEIISDVAEIQSGTIRLRAVAPGDAELNVSATGEAAGREPNSGVGFFYWSNAAGTLRLTAAP